MLLEFEKKIADLIGENGLFSPDNRILLAVSGGADSTSLMYVMCALKANHIFNGDIFCAHINHQLRAAESDGDEAFVIEQADKLNLAVTTRRLDVRGFARENKLSIETAARKLRIESLLDIAKANRCRCVATAHQKDDNAETIIQRLIRGTGFRGLGGIWPRREFDNIEFVRPLLCVRRDEIIEYLKQRNLKWRTDRMNEDCSYRRSFIRHRLIPELQRQCNGSLAEQLFELAQSSRRFYSLVRSVAGQIWPNLVDCDNGRIALDLNRLSFQHPAVKVEIIQRCLTYLGSGERDLTHQHYERVLELTQQNISGRKIELPSGFVVRREYDKLIFTRPHKAANLKEKVGIVEVQIPGRTKFGGYLIEADIFEAGKKNFGQFKSQKTNFVEWFDLDKVKLPLTVRFRRAGDKFWPLGTASEKKVGKFFTSAKVPQQIRKKALIVVDSEKIIWIWPVRIGEQTKVIPETGKILQLRITGDRLAD